MNKPLQVAVLHMAEGDAGSGGAAGAAGAQGGEKGGGTPGKGAATFTQEHLDSVVAKERRTWQAQVEELKTQLDTLQGSAHTREVQDAEAKKKYDEATQLLQQGFQKDLEKANKRADTYEGMYRELAINKAIFSAAVEGKAVKPDEVVALLKDNVKLDSAGVPRFTDGSTVQDGVKKYLDANLHHVQPSGRQGAGSGRQGAGGGQAGAIQGDTLAGLTLEQLQGASSSEILRVARSRANNPFRPAVKE